MTNLEGSDVLVTGGAGTIGSTIVDQLLDAGVAHIDVLDNLVRGRRANLDGGARKRSRRTRSMATSAMRGSSTN